MKRTVMLLLLVSFIMTVPALSQEDRARDEALKQFDDEVDGATRLQDTVPPLSEKRIYEDCAPLWFDDPFYGPEFGLEDEREYRRLEEER
jgi:hypothetical protein